MTIEQLEICWRDVYKGYALRMAKPQFESFKKVHATVWTYALWEDEYSVYVYFKSALTVQLAFIYGVSSMIK